MFISNAVQSLKKIENFLDKITFNKLLADGITSFEWQHLSQVVSLLEGNIVNGYKIVAVAVEGEK